MPNPVTPADPGLLASLADQISLPGYALRNLFRGDLGAAARNAADFGLNMVDAVLPGDLIPQISSDKDKPDFRDVVDTGDDLLGDVANFAGNVLTDPLTYVPGAAVAKAGGAIAKGVKAITPQVVQKAAGKAAQGVRATFGAQRVSKEGAAALLAGNAAKDAVERAGNEAAFEGLKGITPAEKQATGEILNNLALDPATMRPTRIIDPSETMSLEQRTMQHLVDKPELDPMRIAGFVKTARGLADEQLASGQASDFGGGVFTPGPGAKNYFPQQFTNTEPDALLGELAGGNPSAIKGRTLERTQDRLNYLNENPNINLEFDPAAALTKRTGQQGELAKRAVIGDSLIQRAKSDPSLISDDLLQKLYDEMPKPRMPVGRATEDTPDINRLFGGESTNSGADLLRNLTAQSGKAIAPITPAIEPTAADLYGIGAQTGKAIVPATPEVEQAAADIYGIGSQSGKAKPPGKPMLEDAGQDSRDLYGLGSPSGKSRPPVVAPIEPAIADPLGIGVQSGKSIVPATGEIEPSVSDLLGIGVQSGKSVVGPSIKGGEAIDKSLNQMGLGGQTGKSVVGPSTAGVMPGLTETQKAKVLSWFGDKEYRHADPLMRSAAEAIATQLPEEEAKVMLTALKGMAPRGAATDALAKVNRYFKPYAVYGAIVPKLGSITRNLTGGIWQTLSNAEARGDLPRAIVQAVPNWLKSVDDGVEKLFGKRIGTNEFAEVDAAYKASGGDPRKVLASISDPTMREAVKHGVLGNNFVDTEGLINSFNKGGWKKLGGNLMDYPGAMFKGAEQRMRYGLYKSLRGKGHSEQDAARIVSDTFYDYGISSESNRLARDIIPFFQFSAKAIPQQAKFLAEKPVAASALANLYNQNQGEPVMPNMEGKLNIPIGQDEQGNRQYLTSLGLPVEALGMLPNLSADPLQAGRQVEQNIIGSTQPLLKTLYAYTANRDPYFGSSPGSYTKVAGQDLGKTGSVINQLLNAGLPFASAGSGLLGQAGKLSDDKTSVPEALAGLLTGAKLQSVDPNRAIQLRLQNILERTPSVDRFTQLYDKSKDPDTMALLQQLRDAKAAIKKKKEAALPSN